MATNHVVKANNVDVGVNKKMIKTFEFPPGYRFCPTDEELVHYYLQKKIDNLKLPHDKIKDVNFYATTPDKLSKEHDAVEENVWYFFTSRDKKYPNGQRPDRKANRGGKEGEPASYWKATGADKDICHPEKGKEEVIGKKKTLIFCQGKPPHGDKTNWIMHEFRVTQTSSRKRHDNDMTLDDWVLCKIYIKKSSKGKQNCYVALNSEPVKAITPNPEPEKLITPNPEPEKSITPNPESEKVIAPNRGSEKAKEVEQVPPPQNQPILHLNDIGELGSILNLDFDMDGLDIWAKACHESDTDLQDNLQDIMDTVLTLPDDFFCLNPCESEGNSYDIQRQNNYWQDYGFDYKMPSLPPEFSNEQENNNIDNIVSDNPDHNLQNYNNEDLSVIFTQFQGSIG